MEQFDKLTKQLDKENVKTAKDAKRVSFQVDEGDVPGQERGTASQSTQLDINDVNKMDANEE